MLSEIFRQHSLFISVSSYQTNGFDHSDEGSAADAAARVGDVRLSVRSYVHDDDIQA